MMSAVPKFIRWGIFSLSGLLTLFLIWLFGFILDDIGDVEGPNREDFANKVISTELREQVENLKEEIRETDSALQRQNQIQETLGRSKDNAGQAMEKLAELQQMSLEGGGTPDEAEREALARARTRFLDAQDDFEKANVMIAELNGKKHTASSQLQLLEETVKKQGQKADADYWAAWRTHKTEVGTWKLLFIVPVLLASAWLWRRRKGSLVRPLFLACLIASFFHVASVMFEHFPEEYVKYIAIGAAILIVVAFLMHLLRSAEKPNTDILLNQRREAYDKGHCPECAYPWPGQEKNVAGQVGACPACGIRLFEACSDCGNRRHSLLPHCAHCGATSNPSG